MPGEMADAHTLWNGVLTAMAGGAAWIMRSFATRVDEHQKDIASTRELLLRDYVPKAELLPRLDKIDEKLDRIIATKKEN